MHVHHDENGHNHGDHGDCCGPAKSKAKHDAAKVKAKSDHGKHAHMALLWSGLLAGGSHIFCCVLPGLFSILALLSGFGIIVALPGWLDNLHEAMHDWELLIIGFSGAIITVGWAVQYYSRHNDCHDHGCEHSSCQPRKNRAGRVLILATVLFLVNVTVYAGFHAKGEDHNVHDEHVHEGHEH